MKKLKRTRVDSRVSRLNNTLSSSVRDYLARNFPGRYRMERVGEYLELYPLSGADAEIHLGYSGQEKYHFKAHCFIGSMEEHDRERLRENLPQASLVVKELESKVHIEIGTVIPGGAAKNCNHSTSISTVLAPLLAFLSNRK